VILDAGANGDDLDITAAEDLTALVVDLHAAGVDFAIAEVRHPVREMARRSTLLEALGEDRIFHSIQDAVEALKPK
jgi:MFS superfamily sulfate permease-like transporter